MLNFNDQSRPPPITYGCVCSGISAPTLAAKHLGWKIAFFSEIDKFPRAVLQHHYASIPLHSDFTTIQKDTYGTVDLLVGGTPCQSFSVAGKRLGLDDPRGNLALEYGALATRLHALWLAFENVPGLLSSAKGEDFAAFISAITGIEYRPPAAGWKNAGIAEGRTDRWGIAWRILDGQYFGVAQRRRRLFVIGYRGDWRPAAAVLLEPDSMRGDSPPSRKAQANVAALTAAGVGTCSADDNQAQAGHLIAGTLEAAAGRSGGAGINPGRLVCANLAETMRAGGNTTGGHRPPGTDVDTASTYLIAHSLRGEGFDASEDGTGRGTPLVPVAFSCKDDGRDVTNDLSPTLRSMNHDASHANGGGQVAVCYPILEPGSRTGVSTTDPRAGMGVGDPEDPMFTLQSGKQHGIAVSCFPINTQMALRDEGTSNSSREGVGLGKEGDPAFTLQAHHSHAIAMSLRGRDGGATAELSGDVMPAIRASQGGGDKPHVLVPSAVRRLTPIECERLQGMPDNYTLVPHGKNKAKDFREWFEYLRLRVTGLTEMDARQLAADGPRYKAIGNSMAVPCVKWIFDRLDHVHRTLLQSEKAA
ncbi:DNA (cytosine-5-)-methyltransferase [Acidicapsa acidisoli]|uniref:DNA (cytosine-5-)-methyltransferase n=1 Tax=Acidicapsa acidisoli TaxID=1615681 RepID=UPI0021DF425D|nr:DNA (cytosine-5-)-methyltransferase [Acidicapsa acidisoli]